MTKITELQIEQSPLEFFEKQGYHYIYGPNIAPDTDDDKLPFEIINHHSLFT